MRDRLLISNVIIESLVYTTVKPQPRENILWLYFPRSKGDRYDFTDYANDKPVWVALYADKLSSYSEEWVKFVPGTINHTLPSTAFNLRKTGYKLKDNLLKSSCPKFIILPKEPKVRRVNNTVFVDAVFGNDATGEVENPERPFQTINAGIQAIRHDEIQVGLPGWVVKVTPGQYNEIVTVPSNVYLSGAGFDQTFISGLRIIGWGNSTVSSLKIISQQSPAVEVFYDSPELINRPINLDNVHGDITGDESTIVLRQFTGSNGNINLRGLNFNISSLSSVNVISADDPTLNPTLNFEVKQLNSFFEVLALSVNFLQANRTRYFTQSGLIALRLSVPTRITNQSTLFTITSGQYSHDHSNLRITGLVDTSVLLYQAENASINSANVSTSFNDISQNNQILANAIGDSRITILGSTFPNGNVPRIIGDRSKVRHVGHSLEGDVISSGTSAHRIRPWSSNPVVSSSDYHILVDVPNSRIPLLNPSELEDVQTFRGTQQIFTNSTSTPIVLTGPFSGDVGSLTLNPGQVVQLQATETSWTVTSLSSSSSITMSPSSVLFMNGQVATFTAAAAGNPPVQWQVSTTFGQIWTDIPGATSTTLEIMMTPETACTLYIAVFTNDDGSTISTKPAQINAIMSSRTNAGTLIVLDPNNGEDLREIGFSGFNLSALALFQDGFSINFYGGSSELSPSSPGNLIGISFTTGAGTALGSFLNESQDPIAMVDMAYSTGEDLFGFGNDNNLYQIGYPPTSTFLVGSPGPILTGAGIAFVPDGTPDGRLYLFGNDDINTSLWVLNSTNGQVIGAPVVLSLPDGYSAYGGLTSYNGVLYGLISNSTDVQLVIINLDGTVIVQGTVNPEITAIDFC